MREFWREHNDLGSMRRRLAPLLGLVAALAVFLLWPADCLVAQSGGSILIAAPIQKGVSFEVTFTHSVNRSPVTDVIEWTGQEMMVRKSVFKTFGAGIPIPADGIGTELVHIDGHYELLGIDKPMQSFAIMTQEIPDHRITLDGHSYSLLALAGSGKVVDIRVQSVSRVARWANRVF